jgi:hypothetical protein
VTPSQKSELAQKNGSMVSSPTKTRMTAFSEDGPDAGELVLNHQLSGQELLKFAEYDNLHYYPRANMN